MAKSDTKSNGKKTLRAKLRKDGTRVQVFNSGLEVWLYDNAHYDKLKGSRAMASVAAEDLTPHFRAGQIAVYELSQDDGLDIEVIVGEPLSEKELRKAAWLEPQTAYLHIPSGELCVESNDARRVGPEEPTDQGARIQVPPGHYRMSLYRIDFEALDREGKDWKGPQEVVVLTPGGSEKDAAIDVLPFQLRRDLSWVKNYSFRGSDMHGLIWFDDSWDTFTVNIDEEAAQKLGLEPGVCFTVRPKTLNVTLLATYCTSWKDGAALQPPAQVALDEYGYGAPLNSQQWDGAECLFCRRARAKVAIPDYMKHMWTPAIIRVMNERATVPARVRGELLHDAGKRVFWRGDLSATNYYHDLQFLTARLMGRVENVPWGQAIPVNDAISRVDASMQAIGLTPCGEFSFDVEYPSGKKEFTNRLYVGLDDTFAALWGSDSVFELFFFSELPGEQWLLTGTVPEGVAKAISERSGLSVQAVQGQYGALLDKHRERLAAGRQKPRATPKDLREAVEVYERYLKVALD